MKQTEAFAAQSVAVVRDLNFDMKQGKVTGMVVRLHLVIRLELLDVVSLLHLLHEMQKRRFKRGLATLLYRWVATGRSTIVRKIE